ncbi:hypothetical protein CFB03_14405 [Salmonella enterica subsp. enterica serovar Typhimurium]|nr:hypothetical protein CFB03_14405 [Salmonella enterica subsp. enterica serovar Typhimurium]
MRVDRRVPVGRIRRSRHPAETDKNKRPFFFRHGYIPYYSALPFRREHGILVFNPAAYLPRASITA